VQPAVPWVDPIMPLAPLRLSTITVWPSASLSFSARSREIMSMVGPGGTGTMMVIGLAVGQVCAQADPYAARKHTPIQISPLFKPNTGIHREFFRIGRKSGRFEKAGVLRRWACRLCKERASTVIARVTGGSGRKPFIC
jgi:hypothetical protein